MNRLLIVSNRLPITAQVEGNEISLDPSTGGLVTGLRGPHERSEGLWVGWPGELPRLSEERRRQLEQRLAELRLVPVYLTRREIRDYYEQIANGALWPVFHYSIERLPWHPRGWDTFRAVNERFAEAIAQQYRPGDLVWVHDYHLVLVPWMLRRLVPDARIGFFLHIPFPAQEVFRVLPWRGEILRGLMGADLIGFHTSAYLKGFVDSVRQVLGLETAGDSLLCDGRVVALGEFPMGIDSLAWAAWAEDPEVEREIETFRRESLGRTILLGMDRLDYTKGIPGRLLALEELFEREPALSRRARFVQVTVPSRERVEDYATLRRRIDELVGHINSRFATPTVMPIHRVHKSLPQQQVAALYGAADVLLATPLRDGMNLVAKEFVASRTDGDGVLVLSEFAGAAAELREALLVNPYDVGELAHTIRQALDMPEAQRRARMKALRDRVMEHDVNHWADSYLSALRACR